MKIIAVKNRSNKKWNEIFDYLKDQKARGKITAAEYTDTVKRFRSELGEQRTAEIDDDRAKAAHKKKKKGQLAGSSK